MELFSTLAGNEKIKKTLARDILNSKHSHAYIIEGPAGSGKHTVAYLTAASLFCTDRSESLPCGKCTSCYKTFEKVNTDIIVISRGDKATIGVDEIRKVKETLTLAPVEMNHKVYIIEEAERMTIQAQNALLLSLEEPPRWVMFILLCNDSTPLLETVKSRAPIIKTELFSKEFIMEHLKNKKDFSSIAKSDPKRFEEACIAGAGSIGAAMALLSVKKSKSIHETREKVEKVVHSLCCTSQTERIELLSIFPTARIELVDFLSLVLLALRDILSVKKSNSDQFLFYTDRSDAEKIASRTSTKKLCTIQAQVSSAIGNISSNVSSNAVLTLLLTQ